jgi:plasmid replication initiation protein
MGDKYVQWFELARRSSVTGLCDPMNKIRDFLDQMNMTKSYKMTL